VVAQELEALPWKLFVPDLVTALTDAPECIPFCARESAGRDAELLQRVRERQRQVGVVLRIVVDGAVEQIRDAEVQSAATAIFTALPPQSLQPPKLRLFGCPVARRRRRAQSGPSPAALQRQLDDALVLDDILDAGALDVDERRRALNGDGLGDVCRARATH
jgi:hypothetical protein